MKPSLVLAATAVLPALSEPPAPVPAGTYTRDGWELVWSEEFDGSGPPDPAVWTPEVGYVRNQEPQYYTAGREENAVLRDGCLVITARRESVPNAAYEEGSGDWRKVRRESEYTSACLESSPGHLFHYGRIEVRAQMPRTPGAWPAIWMMGQAVRLPYESPDYRNWPACGEIDILEIWAARANKVCTTLHTAKEDVRGWKDGNHRSFGSASLDLPDAEAPWNGFHTYTMDWDEHSLYFYYDGRLYDHVDLDQATLTNGRNPFRLPHFLLLNLALGGWDNALSPDTAFPIEFKIDYVRHYRRLPAP